MTNLSNNRTSGTPASAAVSAPRFKTLSGVVERITFQSEETGYTVARLLPDGRSDASGGGGGNPNKTAASPRGFATKGDDNLVTIVGTLTSVAPGEALELMGLWQQHHQHGWQFKVENYRSVLPATTQGIRKYLGSGLIKGIGPKTAEKIVAYFDTETLDILESAPERLAEVPKLGKHKAGLIAAAWVEQKAIKEVMVFLQGQGISTSLAVRIYKQYKDAAITVVKNEPYRLAREVWGIGFKTADKIASSLGFAHDDPERLKAGTLFVLSEASDSGGHTYLPRPMLAKQAAELLGVEVEKVEEAIGGLTVDGGAYLETLVADPDDGSLSFQPLVAVTVFGSNVGNSGAVAANANATTTANGRGKPSSGSSSGSRAEDAAATNLSVDDSSYSPLEDDLADELRYSARRQRLPLPSASASTSSSSAASSRSPVVQAQNPANSPTTTTRAGIGTAGAGIGATNPISSNESGATPTLTALPGEQAVYLPPFYWAEQGVAKHLMRLANCTPQQDRLKELARADFRTVFDFLANKDETKLQLAERQQEGVVMALAKPVGVLTGGPGTGKTTSMKALIRVLSLKKKRVVLAAPTGRAAKRLSEATGLEAKTLHRLLALKPGGKSQYDYKEKPIEADIVIIDEVSMLDTLLMYSLLKGIATGTHLLLVGDADQLPSVGAGNVLSDIINSEVVPVVKLDQIFRQGAGSAIITNAHRINQGLMPIVRRDITDFFFFGEEDPEAAGDLVVDLVAKRIPTKFGFAPGDIQVLAPMHRGKSGVGYLNEKLQEVLNPSADNKPQKLYGSKVFRVGDKVLQLRNNYDKQVYNGDGGTITALHTENQTVSVRLEDDREVEYDFGELDELTLAYAISIHKSQGSEYPVCVIPVAMGHFMLLERKLIYTAITRAKKLVVLVGSKKALAMAVRNGPKIELGKVEPKMAEANGAEMQTTQSNTATISTNSNQATNQHRAGRYTGLAIRLFSNSLH
jgi:ATP-dependent exoDNAse (exonuclease V) alpha subunit